MKRRTARWLTILAVVLCAGRGAAAEDNRVLSDKWYVTVGGYLAELSTDAAVGTGSVVGTLIRAEDELGLADRKSTIRVQADRRLGQRHTVGLEYLKIDRSGSTAIEDSIEWKGNVYEIGAELSSAFDTELFQFTYRYSFVNDGKTEAGLQAGLSTWSLSAELAGEATIDDGTGGTTTEFVKAGEDLLAPVPSVGLYMRHAFGRRLVLQANARFFRVTLGDIEGRMVDSSLTLDYFFSRHVGIGIGASGTDMRYRNTGDDPVLFEYRQNGAIFYLGLAF